MRAEYKRDVSRNYLILHGENQVDTASYQVRMLTGNAVPSILKCRIQGLDGRFLFYYDITSRQSLASFYEQKKLKASDLRIIFGGVVKIMEEMMEFLLNPDQLLLSPEYMYLDVEKQKLYFCCLPGEAKAVSEQFREMTEYFLPKLDHDDAAAVTMGYGIYRKALETGVQLDALKEFIYQSGTEEPAENKEPTKPEEKISEQTVLREEQIPLDFAEKPPEWEEKSETSNKTGGKIRGNLGCSCCLEFWRRVIWDISPEFRLRRCWQQRSRFWVLEHLGCGQVRKRRKSRTKQRNGERKSAGNLQMPQGILKKQNSTKSSGMSTEKDCSSKNRKRQITVRQSFFPQEQSRDRPAL